MYLTYNIREEKVCDDLELLFFMHVNDGDRYGSFGNTVIEQVWQPELLI